VSWLYLAIAIVLEVIGTTSLRYSEGFSKVLPSIVFIITYGASFYALTLALRRIDLSVAYAVWAGVGTALVALIGITVFREPLTVMKVAAVGMIVGGVVLLNLGGSAH